MSHDLCPIPAQDLTSDTGIDLENIVYYRDDTHYFVMTAKKDSLLKKRVLHKVRMSTVRTVSCVAVLPCS